MSDFDAIDSLLDAVGPQAELPPCQVRRELRERARLSKAQVARALGVSPSTLSGWESGRDPAGEIRTKYAYLLDGLNAKLATETDAGGPTAGAAHCVRHCCDGRHRHRLRRNPARTRTSVELLAAPEPCVLCGRPGRTARGGVRSAPGPRPTARPPPPEPRSPRRPAADRPRAQSSESRPPARPVRQRSVPRPRARARSRSRPARST